MEKVRYRSAQEWLSEEKWKEWNNSIFVLFCQVWLVVLLLELFLFIFFQPTAECSRSRYFFLFIIKPSGLQMLVLLGYRLLTNRKRKNYYRYLMSVYAICMISLFGAVMVCIHTSVALMPMLLLTPMLLTPLYKDRLMTVLQAVLMIAVYIVDCFYFIPHSPYLPPTSRFIEISIFIGAVIACLAVMELVNDFAIMEQERSKQDSLTHLYNHECFYEELEYRRKRFAEQGEKFSVVIADIDNFKSVNDTYGHAFGDRVIRQVADDFVEIGGKTAFCARYGGEEFTMILPGAGKEKAAVLAEEIRQRFAAHEFGTNQGKRQFTLSLGVAEYDKLYPSASTFFEKVDQVLYQAKREGKNRVKR